MIRSNTNLRKMTDAQLSAIVETIVASGFERNLIEQSAHHYEVCRARKAVRLAAAAYDWLEYAKTKSHHTQASPETLAWSSMEGGHEIHEVPHFDIAKLVAGVIEIKGYKAHGK